MGNIDDREWPTLEICLIQDAADCPVCFGIISDDFPIRKIENEKINVDGEGISTVISYDEPPYSCPHCHSRFYVSISGITFGDGCSAEAIQRRGKSPMETQKNKPG